MEAIVNEKEMFLISKKELEELKKQEFERGAASAAERAAAAPLKAEGSKAKTKAGEVSLNVVEEKEGTKDDK